MALSGALPAGKAGGTGTQCLNCGHLETPAANPHRCMRCGSCDLHLFPSKAEWQLSGSLLLFCLGAKFAFCLKVEIFPIYIYTARDEVLGHDQG